MTTRRATRGRPISAALLALTATAAAAFHPQPGTYWVVGEPGTAYNIEVQEGVLVATIYTYRDDGEPLWYLVAGAMQNGQRTLTAPLERYRGGNALGTPQRAPTMVGWDGNISFSFVSPIAADVTLPSGRQVRIERFNFGHQAPPAGLLGEWTFVVTGSVLPAAYQMNLTATAASALPPGAGTGMALDTGRIAACEYVVSGTLAGKVLCVDVNSSGTTTAQFVFTYGLDETYDGQYVSPTTGATLPMKGWRTRSATGHTKTAAADADAAQVHGALRNLAADREAAR